MDIKTSIEVEAFGDFDVSYTDCILVSPDEINVKGFVKNYLSLRGLESESGLPLNMIYDTRKDFIEYAKKNGFFVLKTKKVCFSD